MRNGDLSFSQSNHGCIFGHLFGIMAMGHIYHAVSGFLQFIVDIEIKGIDYDNKMEP